MRKAWAFDARKIWVVNVGDIKPHEIGMELFRQMGWDITRGNSGNIVGFLEQWAAREFGAEYAEETSEIMRQYYLLNYPRKPEHMGFYDKYSIAAVNQDPAC